VNQCAIYLIQQSTMLIALFFNFLCCLAVVGMQLLILLVQNILAVILQEWFSIFMIMNTFYLIYLIWPTIWLQILIWMRYLVTCVLADVLDILGANQQHSRISCEIKQCPCLFKRVLDSIDEQRESVANIVDDLVTDSVQYGCEKLENSGLFLLEKFSRRFEEVADERLERIEALYSRAQEKN